MKRKQQLTQFVTMLVILAQVLASISAATTAVIQPSALASVLGAPKVAQAAAPVAPALASQPVEAAASVAPALAPDSARIEAAAAAPPAAPVAKPLAAGGPASISGLVYNDINFNGVKDTGEVGIGGVTVTAYDATGVAIASTTASTATATLGQYTLTGLPASTPVRLEFTTLSTGYQPAPAGSSNGTSVQFMTTTSGALSNVNFGVNQPCDYCQSSPQLMTTNYIYGNPLLGTPSTTPGLFEFSYDVPNRSTGPTSDATVAQLGAAWGVAYQRSNRLVFISAFQRRFSGYGPLGTGGIYLYNRTTNALTNWLDVNTLPGVNTGGDPHSGLPATSAGNDATVRDSASYDAVGKVSLGGLDVSTDGSTLWAMNLNQRTLLEIPLVGNPPVTPTTVKLHNLSNLVSCTNGVFRPWAVQFHYGKVYVGGVCSGENGGTRADLSAYVFVHDPAGAVGSFTQVYSQSLNYAKGCSLRFGGNWDCNGWNPWQTTWPAALTGATWSPYTQPILSGITFDVDGSLILGFGDRWGYQTGTNNYGTNPADFAGYNGTTGGDTLRVCLVNGVYVGEGGVGCPKLNADSNSPGVYEFYQDVNGNGGNENHPETSLGALTLLPGRGEVVSTKLDPYATFSLGVTWLNNTTGLINKDFYTTGNSWSKASGIGDVELLCNPAPIEIGNRVWKDTNSNGIQDAGEPGLSGVLVSLYDSNNNHLATVATDAQGAYYFSSAAGTDAFNVKYNLAALKANTSGYQVRIDTTQSALNGLGLTTADADSSANGDARDSDAQMNSANAVITVTTGSAGANDHTYDFGFKLSGVGIVTN